MYIVINKVVLNVPNLEYFLVGGVLCSLFVMKDLSNLVEASVSFFDVRFNHLEAELLNGMSGAKSLSWSTSTVDVSFFQKLQRITLFFRHTF